MTATKKQMVLVHQGVWNGDKVTRKPSMPLACGYLKAIVETDPELASRVDVRIVNLLGGESTVSVMEQILADRPPEFLGFSVLGWNYDKFGRIADAYRSLKPDGWVVFGGTHVGNQGERVFGMFPSVDMVVDGEAEPMFAQLTRAWLDGVSARALHDIAGISFRDAHGQLVKTPPADIAGRTLDHIPSPILSGALPLTDANGEFLYDTALLETNRGCPYSCAFCYWGGAIGQKIRTFSLERLAAEVEMLAEAGAEKIVLCDANFGVLERDEAFVEICISARDRHGYPKSIFTSWAKEKRKSFFRGVERMSEAGFHSSFNLALQSLNDSTLDEMNRRNMRINDWQDLAAWLHAHDMLIYAELLWGCPGETVESFLAGYDKLAQHVSRIAVYPLLLLPNTDYAARKKELGLVTWRPLEDDFERVLCHNTMSIADNHLMHGFLFWSCLIAEHRLFRYLWKPLADVADFSQSRLLMTLDDWISSQNDPAALRLRRLRDLARDELDFGPHVIERGLAYLFDDPDAEIILMRWWDEAVSPILPAAARMAFSELFRFEWLSLPVYGAAARSTLPRIEENGEAFWLRDGVRFAVDVPAMLEEFKASGRLSAEPRPCMIAFVYRTEFCVDRTFYHQAHAPEYFGVVREVKPLPSLCEA